MKQTITQSNRTCQWKSSPQELSQHSTPEIGDSGWSPKIDKYPVVAYVIIRDGKYISSCPCNCGGELKLARGAEIIGIVPAPPGIETVEYCSAIEIDDNIFVRLGCQRPNETTDWEAKAIEMEEFRLSQVESGPGSPRRLSKEEFDAVSQ